MLPYWVFRHLEHPVGRLASQRAVTITQSWPGTACLMPAPGQASDFHGCPYHACNGPSDCVVHRFLALSFSPITESMFLQCARFSDAEQDRVNLAFRSSASLVKLTQSNEGAKCARFS